MDNIITILFFPFFICFFTFIIFFISKAGWSDLAAKYQSETPFRGRRIGTISAGINLARYNNALVLFVSDKGMYIKSVLLFRPFHPAILIPWKEVMEVKEKKILFTNYFELFIGNPKVATISLKRSTFKKMFPESKLILTDA